MESDGKQLDADTVKDVLNFVDATTGEEADVAVVAEDMKEGLAGESWRRDRSNAGRPCT